MESVREKAKQRKHARTMLIYRANRVLGLCEKLRMIYDEIADLENREKITELLIDAFIMAKKMDDRLKYYRITYDDTTGHGGKNLESLPDMVAKDQKRRNRPV